MRELGVSPNIPAQYAPELPDLTSDAEVSELIAAIQNDPYTAGMPVKLIVLDTLTRSMGGKSDTMPENQALALKGAERIRRELGCAVILVAHPPRNNDPGAVSDVKDRVAGPKNIEANVDAVLLLKPDPNDRTLLRVTATKVKDGPDDGEILYRKRVVELGTARNPKANGRKVTSVVIDYDVDPATIPASTPGRRNRASAEDKAYGTASLLMMQLGQPHTLASGEAVRAIDKAKLQAAMADAAELEGEKADTGKSRLRTLLRTRRLLTDGALVYVPPGQPVA